MTELTGVKRPTTSQLFTRSSRVVAAYPGYPLPTPRTRLKTGNVVSKRRSRTRGATPSPDSWNYISQRPARRPNRLCEGGASCLETNAAASTKKKKHKQGSVTKQSARRINEINEDNKTDSLKFVYVPCFTVFKR